MVYIKLCAWKAVESDCVTESSIINASRSVTGHDGVEFPSEAHWAFCFYYLLGKFFRILKLSFASL